MFKWIIHHLNALFSLLTPSSPVAFIRDLLNARWHSRVEMITKTLASGVRGCVYELSATLTSLLHRTCTVHLLAPFFPLHGLGQDPSIKINNNNNDNKKAISVQFCWNLFDLVHLSSVQFLLQETMATSPKEVFQPIWSRGKSSNVFFNWLGGFDAFYQPRLCCRIV